MKKNLQLVTLLLLITAYGLSAGEVKFLSDPCPTPDGKEIVFVYEGDIWKVSAAGGTAYRITAMEGSESLPVVSPDGKWIAFSGSADGNRNIYIVSSEGGEITRLTWHSSNDDVDSWSWDSKTIYFTSGRMNSYSGWEVSLTGGTPVRLFSSAYWDNSHFIAPDPVTGDLLFSESGESYRSNNRKRYKGENNPDIKAYNPLTGQFRQLTSWEGKDLWPTVDKNGKLYFMSDEGTGEYNLFTLLSGERKRLTNFTSSAGRPRVSADGSVVAFTLDYSLVTYDTDLKTYSEVAVSLFSDRPLENDSSFDTEGNITSFDVAPDNKKIAFISRGRLFVSDIKGEFVKEIMTDPDERVTEAVWCSDSKTLLIVRTNGGWPNLYRIAADAGGGEIPVLEGEGTVRQVNTNGDRTKAVYYFGRDQLRTADLTNWKEKLLLNDEFWFRGSRPGFSPDSRYVYYTAYRHFESDIKLFDTVTGRTINLTGTFLSEGEPFWSPDNRYIWFTADRTAPSYPRGGGATRLYRIPLRKESEPFRSDRIEELLGIKEKGDEDNTGQVIIDTTRLLYRWETPLRVGARQSNPYVITSDSVTTVIFGSTHEGERRVYKLTVRPFGTDRIEEIKGLRSADIVSAGKDYYAASGGRIYKINLRGNKADEIKISHSFTRNLTREFSQMFYEGWTVLAENYYDEDMHGTDWLAMRQKYEKFLPAVRSRSNLRTLMNDMLGELNSSHMGFSTRGEDETVSSSMVSAASGIIFNNRDPYRVERIVEMSPADYHNAGIKKGDLLVRVNGVNVDYQSNRESYFLFPEMPSELVLDFTGEDGKGKRVKVHPTSQGAINSLLYDEWIASNKERVDKLSGDRIGYVYLKNMSSGSLDKFIIEMTADMATRDALIVDLRYNTGGNIHDDLIKFLSQKPYLNWKFREGMVSPQPHFAPSGKPIVLLINQSSLSDAEMTAAAFKELGLGTIVGTETYRWIIFTSSASLVDGSTCRLPAWGCYTLDGTDLEFSGVKPDLYIRNSFTDIINERDPQLEKSVEVLMQKLNN